MSEIPDRIQRLMVRLWNKGDHSFADIAACTGFSVDMVGEFLARKPGFPDLIIRTKRCGECCEWFATPTMYRRYCGEACRTAARRRGWRNYRRRKEGTPLTAPVQVRRRGMSHADRRVVAMAGEEARERGVTTEMILTEWKFERSEQQP